MNPNYPSGLLPVTYDVNDATNSIPLNTVEVAILDQTGVLPVPAGVTVSINHP